MSSRAHAICAAASSAALMLAGCAAGPKLEDVPPATQEVVCRILPETPEYDVAVDPADREGRAYTDDNIEVGVAVCDYDRPKARPEAGEPVA